MAMSIAIGAGAPLINPDEFRSWILHEDERLLVVNKPGLIVCHPSKKGPWSSLVGAAREYLGLATMHLVFRLDRETSGVVVLAKDSATASKLQKATQRRLIGKRYLAILTGELAGPVTVDQPLGPDPDSCVTIRSKVVAADSPGAQAAVTHFEPVAVRSGFTLVRVRLSGLGTRWWATSSTARMSAFTLSSPSTAGRNATRRCCRFRARRCTVPRSTCARPTSPTSSGRRCRRSWRSSAGKSWGWMRWSEADSCRRIEVLH